VFGSFFLSSILLFASYILSIICASFHASSNPSLLSVVVDFSVDSIVVSRFCFSFLVGAFVRIVVAGVIFCCGAVASGASVAGFAGVSGAGFGVSV